MMMVVTQAVNLVCITTVQQEARPCSSENPYSSTSYAKACKACKIGQTASQDDLDDYTGTAIPRKFHRSCLRAWTGHRRQKQPPLQNLLPSQVRHRQLQAGSCKLPVTTLPNTTHWPGRCGLCVVAEP